MPIKETRRLKAHLPVAGPSLSPRPAEDARERSARIMKLVPLWPHEAADMSYAGRLRLLSKLRRALRKERQKGLAGHWAYDLARHQTLLRTYRAEAAHCLALNSCSRGIGPSSTRPGRDALPASDC
jgi:hypothetical protein